MNSSLDAPIPMAPFGAASRPMMRKLSKNVLQQQRRRPMSALLSSQLPSFCPSLAEFPSSSTSSSTSSSSSLSPFLHESPYLPHSSASLYPTSRHTDANLAPGNLSPFVVNGDQGGDESSYYDSSGWNNGFGFTLPLHKSRVGKKSSMKLSSKQSSFKEQSAKQSPSKQLVSKCVHNNCHNPNNNNNNNNNNTNGDVLTTSSGPSGTSGLPLSSPSEFPFTALESTTTLPPPSVSPFDTRIHPTSFSGVVNLADTTPSYTSINQSTSSLSIPLPGPYFNPSLSSSPPLSLSPSPSSFFHSHLTTAPSTLSLSPSTSSTLSLSPSLSPSSPSRSKNKFRKKRHSMHEMLQVARECSGRDPSELLAFGEGCLYTRELERCYKNPTSRSPVLSKIPCEKSSLSPGRTCRQERNMSKSKPQCQVFLGGSCNPTTWRQDVAIPMLNRHGITYYNPQVSNWEEGLVETEYQAKRTATVLFFVFDPATRNVASMVEAGYMAGCHRKLVLVIDNYTGPGHLINGEPISQGEYEELSEGVLMVQDLVERQGIPVFSQMSGALDRTAEILRANCWPQDLGVIDRVPPVKHPQLQLENKLVKLHDAFININSNRITLSEANARFKVVTGREMTKEELLTIAANKKGVTIQELNSTDLPLQDISLTFQEFCCIVAEFENQPIESQRLWDVLTQSLISPIQKIVDWALPRVPRSPNGQGARDVYLGGSQGSTRCSWRDSVAIPLLRKHGLSYYVPSASSVAGGGGKLLPMEAAHLDNSKVLLFVIPNNARGVAQMALAAYYIGLVCNVVLCVQSMTQGTVVNGEELSAAAIKDYNRGRSYLTDLAKKERIPVFSSIEESMEYVVQKCRTR